LDLIVKNGKCWNTDVFHWALGSSHQVFTKRAKIGEFFQVLDPFQRLSNRRFPNAPAGTIDKLCPYLPAARELPRLEYSAIFGTR
jgi:hypothetical protein